MAADLDYDLFWRIGIAEMHTIMRGRVAAITAAQDRARMVAYEMARWIGFAFHNPRHMPDFKPLVQTKPEVAGEAAARQALVDDAKVRGWFISKATRMH
jgi:hypothetical protein